jgi:hypothetical protein
MRMNERNAGLKNMSGSMSALRPNRLHDTTWLNASTATLRTTASAVALPEPGTADHRDRELHRRSHQNPKPFIWTAKATDIPEKVIRAKAPLNNSRSA